MATEMLQKVEKIKRSILSEPRVGLTEFARSKSWREDLMKSDVMEIVDRTETAGFLVSPDGMRSLLETIENLEQEIEQAQVDALFSHRQNMNDWSSGQELADKAKASLEARSQTIREILDGNQ